MIDDGVDVEAATGAGTDAAAHDSDGQIGLAGTDDQNDIALLFDEAAAGQVGDQRLVDRRALEQDWALTVL